jgi:hypothetical protein
MERIQARRAENPDVEVRDRELAPIEGDILVRPRQIFRWKESGDVAYERPFAVRLSFADDRIAGIVRMPGASDI